MCCRGSCVFESGKVSTLVLGHLAVNVPDLAAAKAYYDRVVPSLGYEEFLATSDEFAYQPTDGKRGTYLFFYPSRDTREYSGEATGLQHLAFVVRTRSEVRAIHDLVTDLGSAVLHKPQAFPQYGPNYFATFWLDPFGFKLEAVCHHDRD
jgi:catechol 2,3-dioxygenase-like lactoylglutathione lyase family enzyme